MADDVESEQALQEEDEVLEDGNYTEDENKDLGFHAGNRTLSGIEESKEQETSSEARHETPESTPPMSRIGVNDHKAGMEGLDKARINEIILEASKGSKFYNNEVKKEKQVSLRIKQMMERMKTLTEAQQVSALKTVDKEIESLECSRHLNRIIVHVDMDAFYAAVEMRDSPKLRNVPMAVGGNSMLSTSNYVARKYGVRAAMPGFIGRKLCPDLVIVPVNFAKYTAVSEQVREVLCRYDPHFSPMGLDESYLDITACVTERHRQMTWGNLDNSLAKEREQTVDDSTDSCILDEDPTGQSDWWEESGVPSHLWSVAQEVVREMRGKIEQQTQLTASAGIAPNKMLAKIASDMNKPNGQYFLTPTRDAVLHFIHSLPIRKVRILLWQLWNIVCTYIQVQKTLLKSHSTKETAVEHS
jgi:DNA polymerase kappa